MTDCQSMNKAKLEEFGNNISRDVSGTLVIAMCSIGDQLGLFKALNLSGPLTSQELADGTGISERYAREWLSCLACAGYIEYSPDTRSFHLPPEHAAFLAHEGGSRFVGGMLQRMPLSWGAFNTIKDAFLSGSGIPLDTYGPTIAEATERGTSTWHDHKLIQQWIPAVPDVQEMLTKGVSVADIGSGAGHAVIRLAETFPRSNYVGFDVFKPSIERAIFNADVAEVSDRVKFESRDIIHGLPGSFDLITTFDVIHDLPHPFKALVAIREALNPDGVYLMLEIKCSDKLQDNFGHHGAQRYGNSIFHCMSTSLGAGGKGLGTMGMPQTVIEEYCREAGFSDVARVDIDDKMNSLYAIRV